MWLNGTSDLISELRRRETKSVALQFPEGLKQRAPDIASQLRNAGFSVIISGDPCYGACDLAPDALEHADVLVHFGHAPVQEHPRVIFDPYRIDFDMDVLDAALPFLQGKKAVLVTTIQHVHLVPAMENYLTGRGVAVGTGTGSTRTPHQGQVLGCSFGAAKIPDKDIVLFVGTGVFHSSGIALATGKPVIALDPLTGVVQEVSGGRMLRRRFAVIEKARDAVRIGVIVSTKSGQQRMGLARYLASLSKNAFIVLMRDVTPDELQNLGFDVYVNTACPRLAYDDQIRFAVPVLSPPEFEILFGVRKWEDYAIDEIG